MGELYNILKASVFSSSGGSGGGSVPHSDVNFYDYDGTVVHSYTADEFAELSEMPSNPTHTGLTAQGWNWSLADAKLYVSKYGKLNIGQMYITSDGKTRLYIHLTKGRTTPNLQLYLNANSELDIDWGDGTAHSTFTTTSADFVNETHAYPTTDGDYVITVTVVSGSFELKSSSTNVSSILWGRNDSTNSPDRAYSNSIHQIVVGNGVTSIGNYAFRACYSLTSVTISDSVTSIGNQAFQGCGYMDYIQFKGTTPPTVSSSDAFSGVSATTLIIVPVNCLQAYTTATNYPNSAAYTYLIFGTYNSGETLPTTSTDGYNLTWYATMEDARNQTNPITQGNGEEVYARGVAV